jgi:KUP system potassium uptake protein
MFRKVVEELVKNNEVNILSRYDSLERNNITGDFQFIISEKFLSSDNELPFLEKIIIKLHLWLKEISLSEERGFGLDSSFVTVEKFPLIVSTPPSIMLKRVFTEKDWM